MNFSKSHNRNLDNFTNYKPEDNNLKKPGFGTINDIFEDSGNRLWFSTEKGINLLVKEKMEFKRFLHDQNDKFSLQGEIVRTINQDQHGNLWIGTMDGGLNIYDIEKNRFTNSGNNPELFKNFDSKKIYSICRASDNTMWIGTEEKGLYRFDGR